MLTTTLLCAALFGAEPDAPVSALDAGRNNTVAAIERHFCEPDHALATLYATPVARVDGHIILAETVLVRYGDYLTRLAESIPPSEFSQRIQELIERDLPTAIQFAATEAVMKTEWSEEQISAVSRHINWLWERELNGLAKQLSDRDSPVPLFMSYDALRDYTISQGVVRSFFESKVDELAPFPGAKEMNDESRAAYQKKRKDAAAQLTAEIVSQAKIETAYSIALPVKSK